MSDPEDASDDFLVDPATLVGIWANSTLVRRGRDEFTIDFYRDIPERSRRVLVLRALVSAAVAFDLRDQLDDAWRGYGDWNMPGGRNRG